MTSVAYFVHNVNEYTLGNIAIMVVIVRYYWQNHALIWLAAICGRGL